MQLVHTKNYKGNINKLSVIKNKKIFNKKYQPKIQSIRTLKKFTHMPPAIPKSTSGLTQFAENLRENRIPK